MTSRERLLAALRGQLPDRVPVCCSELQAYNPYSWENQEPSFAPLMAFIKQHCDAVLTLGCPWYSLGEGQVEQTTWEEGDWHHARLVYHSPLGDLTQQQLWKPSQKTIWTTEHMLKTPDDIAKYLALDFHLNEPDLSVHLELREALGEAGLLMLGLPDPVCLAAEAFDMCDFLQYYLTDQAEVLRLMDALGERVLEQVKLVCKAGRAALGEAWGEVLLGIYGPEYVTPPYMAPAHFSRLVTCYIKALGEVIHASGAMLRVHSHGKVAQVLDDLVHTGMDALDPIEPPPDGDIELATAKRLIGGQVCLFGNLQVRLMDHGTQDEVRQAVTACMRDAKAGGRYVIMPTAAPIDVPLSPQTEANYYAFIETALELGVY